MFKRNHQPRSSNLRRTGWTLAVALMIVGVLFPMATALAVDNTWVGTTAAWETGSNWSLGHVPLSTEVAVIPDATTTANDPNITTNIGTIGGLTVAANGVLTINSATAALAVNGLTSAAGTLTHTLGVLNLGGDLAAAGSFTSATTVTFNGTVTQNITADAGTLTFTNLTVNKTGTLLLARSVTVTGDLTVTAGTLDLAAFTANPGGALSVTAGTLRIGSTNGFPTYGTTATLGATSTVEYYGTVQPIAAETYGNLTLNGVGNKTPAAGLTINGSLTIGAGSIFLAGALTHTINGNLTVTGTFTAGTSTVVLTGVTAQTVTGGLTFNNLSVGSAGVTLSGVATATVGGVLNLGFGRLTGNVTVTGTGSVSGGNLSSFVDGTLTLPVATSPGVSKTVMFPIGRSTTYAPVSITFPLGVVSVGGTLSFSSTAGLHPSAGTSTLSTTQYISRWWAGASAGLTYTSYNTTFTFANPGDLVGSPNTATLAVRKFNSPTWTAPTSSSSTATTATATGFSASVLGDFYVASACTDGTFPSATVAAGGTANTDCSADGATTAALVEAAVVTPVGGTVAISNAAPTGAPAGYTLLGRQVTITAPTNLASAPLVITFSIDTSVVPAGGKDAIAVFQGSTTTPVAQCTGSTASPDPCWVSRSTLTGTQAGDVQIVVRSSSTNAVATTWKFGYSAVKCAGLTATIVGTVGNDTINGTSGDDVIWADAGNDTVDGKGGDDTICLGPGDDTADGGDGNDAIFGGTGNDTIEGGAGNDTIKGKGGADKLYGKGGSDTLKGQGGADELYGQGGDDTLRGGKGNDTLEGAKGDDDLYGGANDDDLTGGSGYDIGYGGSGSDSCSLLEESHSC